MSPPLAVASLGCAFVLAHLTLSHPPVRNRLIAALGSRVFRGAYSVGMVAIAVPWARTWWGARHTTERLWEMFGPLEVFAVLLGMIGFALMAMGVASPAPSSLLARPVDGPIPITPVARITRHPVNMGVAHWATAHLLVTPTVVDFGFYGPLLLTAVIGVLHQDWRMRQGSQAYRDFATATTILPNPRGLATLGERGWMAAGVGIFFAVILFSLHPYVFAP